MAIAADKGGAPDLDTISDLRAEVARLRARLAEQAAVTATPATDLLAGLGGSFHTIFDAAPAAIVIKDADGRYLYANDTWYRATGTTPEMALGRRVEEMFAHWPASVATIRRNDAKLRETGKPVHFEYRELLEAGEAWWLVSKFPIFGVDGELSHIVNIELNITEMKQAEAASQRREARLMSIFENTNVGVSISDDEGVYLSTNAAYRTMLGRGEREFEGRRWSDFTHPDDRDMSLGLNTELHHGAAHDLSLEKRYIRKDGSIVWARLTVLLVPGEEDGKPLNAAFVEDITAQREAQEALRESEAMLNEAQQAGSVGSWVLYFDGDQQVRTTWSAQLCRIFGFEPGFYPRDFEHYLEHVHPDDREALSGSWLSAISAGKSFDAEYRIVRDDGSVRYLHTRSHFAGEASEGTHRCVGASTDITERKQVEAQLRQAQKMEAVGQLTGGVAHDFNNLLAVVSGNLEILLERAADDDGATRAANRAIDAVDRGAALTQRLLAFSRTQALAPEVVDVNSLVAAMDGLLKTTLGETITVEMRLWEELWRCEADPGQLENALINLAINARDAMPSGGALTISTDNARLDDPSATAEAVPSRDFVMLAISDTGTGMSESVVERVFEPFFTTKEVGKGSGLGLSMVYGFARQSGGTVTIESEEGRGSTVRLFLPRAAAEASPARRDAADVALDEGHGERILVVEDNEAVRDITVSQLTGLGYSVLQAGDASEALAVLAGGEHVDLLLSDVVLPEGMNGYELAARIKADYPDVLVQHMSGFVGAEAALAESGDWPELLHKPFRKHQLARVIAARLSARR